MTRALAPLSEAAVVGAAVALADAHGLDEVSIRKVAGALGAGPMRLYGYVATKEELLDRMVEAVYAEVDAGVSDVGETAAWRDTVRRVAGQTRAAALRHPWFVGLVTGRPRLGPHALAVLERTAAALAAAPGLQTDEDVWGAVGLVTAYQVGRLAQEVAERVAVDRTGVGKREWQAEHGPQLLALLATGRYPTVARLVAAPDRPPETAYARGLEVVLDGFESVR